MPSPKLDDSVCVFVSDGLLNIQHRLLFLLSPLHKAGPDDHSVFAGSACAEFGTLGKKALQIKYAVTSSKGVSNCDLNQKWEMIVFYNARYKQN